MAELNPPGQEDDLPSGPSKSQIKREWQALQELAGRLLDLSPPGLAALPLSAATRAAVGEGASLRDRRARRRHVKYLAKLLDREEGETIARQLDGAAGQTQAAVVFHHRLERWRDRLIAEGDAAAGELFAAFPHLDRPRLRLLVRAARAAQARPEASRRLFRFLREALAGETLGDSETAPGER